MQRLVVQVVCSIESNRIESIRAAAAVSKIVKRAILFTSKPKQPYTSLSNPSSEMCPSLRLVLEVSDVLPASTGH
jgi:hypothetical protein